MGRPIKISGINNMELFKIAMATMARIKEMQKENSEIKELTEEWCRDVEFSAVAYAVAKQLDDIKYDEQAIDRIITIELLKSELPAPADECDFDCWYGIVSGDYFGRPQRDNLMTLKEAFKEYAKDTSVGYLSQIFDRHPEWKTLYVNHE